MPVPFLAINDLPEEPKDKDKIQDFMVTELDIPGIVHVSRQTKVPKESEGTFLVATDSKELIQTGPLLEGDSTEA